jgi:ABC-type Zn uptake system ZnuABC Zn-binding protein ZnuA
MLTTRRSMLLAVLALAAAVRMPAAETQPLNVCATVPDLGELAKEVGGDEVRVSVFAKGTQDPHFLEAKPAFIKELSQADLFIEVGLELEVGWAPVLLRSARNGKVLGPAPGFLDASTAISPLGIPAGVVDRSQGDIHTRGNPHYLVDPLNGLRVARAIRDRLAALRPEKKGVFEARCEDFSRRLREALVGRRLAQKYDVEKLAQLAEAGKLEAFLEKQGDAPLEGWLGRLAAARGKAVVADHDVWPYLARRAGLRVVGFLEPRPGIAPTTKHLTRLVASMKGLDARAVLAVPYFDPRHARFIAEETGARIVTLAHQCGARPGTDRYLDMVEHNVKALEDGLREAK